MSKSVINRLATTCVALAACWAITDLAAAQRSLGIDVSAWQGNITQANWNTLRNVNNREFVFIRSSRGGTTGFYNQSDADNSDGLNTLSQRYDDPYFVQNITLATNAGFLAGPYHFSRPDIVESTLNSGGIANTGTDEADHFIQMAGAWMRPGYLLPVFDLETGDGIRSDAAITQFSIDFSNRIFEVTGVRPIMYINGNYAANVVQSPIQDYFPVLWTARYANQSDPDSIPIQTGHPKDTFSGFYGPWDDPPNTDPHPWDFWQYASTARLSGYRNGTANIDVNVANGGTEFLRDNLVPALWVSNSSGSWTSLANWNSGQTPTAPVQGPGQVPRVGPLTLPATRLPGALDTVVLDRTAANVTVTLSSGSHEIRKLVAREALDITGGVLTVNYTPVAESTPYSTLFSAPVALKGGSLVTHTTVVEPSTTFTLQTGVMKFDSIQLAPHSTSPAGLAVTGNMILAPLTDATATIERGAGAGVSGVMSLGGGARTLTIAEGAAAVDVSIDVTMSNGSLVKAGPGTLRLTKANSLAGTTVSEGTLLLSNATGATLGSGIVAVLPAGTLAGFGNVGGGVIVQGSVAPTAFGSPLAADSYDFQTGSTLQIDIGGPASYDALTVGDSLTIDSAASLSVAFAPGFTPIFGQSFAIIQGAESVSGAFGVVTSNGPAMAARTVADGVVLEVLSGLSGDFNNDGSVDGADLTVWATNYGQPASALLNAGGATTVDAALYTVWRDNQGTSIPSATLTVPEPTAVGLIGAGVGVLLRLRR